MRTYRRYETDEVNDPAAGFEQRRAGRRQLLARIAEELAVAAEELRRRERPPGLSDI